MDEDQINALAREYAEEKTDAISFKAYSDPEFKKKLSTKGYANDAREVIEWLLRLYCLVEKSKVKTKHKEALAALESNDNEDVKWGTYRLSLLKSLFPDLGKEVE